MILISKVLFGSVALATLAGSVVLADAVDVAHSLAASLQWSGTVAEADEKSVRPAAYAEPTLLPSGLQHCSGSCDVWALLSQIH